MAAAFATLVAGLVMFACGSWLLYYNEGRSAATAEAIGEAQRVTVDMSDVTKISPEFEGKMIHATGFADTKDTVTDSFSGLETTAISLRRQVEYYQWVESSKTETRKKVGGGEEKYTTYTYRLEWKNSPVDSSVFKDPQYVNKNTVLTTVPPETTFAKNVSFGAYSLPQFILQEISDTVPSALNLPQERIAELNAEIFPNAGERSFVHAQNNVIYLGLSPSSPEIGDVRVTYTEVKPSYISILAQVIRNTFEPFRASNNNTFSAVAMGTAGAENMYGDAFTSNMTLTWGLRVAGIALVMFSIGLIMSPLPALVSVAPILGSIAWAGTYLVAFVFGLAWSLIIIAAAWLRFRPLASGGILIVALALIVLFRMKRNRKDAIV